MYFAAPPRKPQIILMTFRSDVCIVLGSVRSSVGITEYFPYVLLDSGAFVTATTFCTVNIIQIICRLYNNPRVILCSSLGQTAVQTETGLDRRSRSGSVRKFCLSVQTGLDCALYGPDRGRFGPLSDYS